MRRGVGDQHFKVWRALLQPDSRQREQSSKELPGSLQAQRRRPGHWAVILSRGGHFAATLFDVHVKPGRGQGKHETPPFEVFTHKTFHKYVVRCGKVNTVCSKAHLRDGYVSMFQKGNTHWLAEDWYVTNGYCVPAERKQVAGSLRRMQQGRPSSLLALHYADTMRSAFAMSITVLQSSSFYVKQELMKAYS